MFFRAFESFEDFNRTNIVKKKSGHISLNCYTKKAKEKLGWHENIFGC